MSLKDFTSNTAGPPSNNGNPPNLPGGVSLASMINGDNSVDVESMLINYNERFKNATPALFRDQVITQTISVLISKNKANALLVGMAGVGKTAIVEDIARRIANKDSLIPDQLHDYTVYELPLSTIVAGASIVGSLEKRLIDLLEFLRTTKSILFIDEIHMISEDNNPIYSKIAQILKPALARGDIKVIGATTLQESRSFDNDPALKRRFTRLIVEEFNNDQTFEILKLARNSYISHFKNMVAVSDDTLHAIVTNANQYSRQDAHRPDNALTLLDRSMADRILSYQKALTQATALQDQNLINTLQASTPLTLDASHIKRVAINLMRGNAVQHEFEANAFHTDLSRILGQDDVIDRVKTLIRNDQANIYPRTKPLTMLFAGASGVGKTEVARIIAKHITNEEPIILNMAEYRHGDSINRIIGSSAGYVGYDSNMELPFDCLESNPYRVILLDEIEKSNEGVQRLFLSAFETGEMSTSRGRTIDFSKSIIIATTNAARESLSNKTTGFNSDPDAKLSYNSLIRKLEGHFEAEFLGRFSAILPFNALSENTYRQILINKYVSDRAMIIKNNPDFEDIIPEILDDAVLDRLARQFVPSQGARPAAMRISEYIESLFNV